MPDLTKLILFSGTPAFKNNKIYTGDVSITGTVVPGLNVREFSIPLVRVPDLVKAIFNGPADPYGNDPRPNDGWSRKCYFSVRGDNAGAGYVNYGTIWSATCIIRGQTAIIRCEYVQQFSDSLSLTPTALYYKITDYSVF